MRLVALYKTWDGEEWIEASLASIYGHVDQIVMVHSETSWLGERGNTVREPAKAWGAQYDISGKITHIDVDCRSQEEQYAAGIRAIRDGDVVLAIDSDEIWETQYLERAKQQIAADKTRAPAYRCNMHSYIKTPFYRVDPPYGSPTTFLRQPELLTESPRGCRAPAIQLDNVWMHHYTYVRRSPDLVWRKIQQSCEADGDEVVVDNWMPDVYDRLPDGIDIHAFVGWRHVWHCVRTVWWSDLPAAVRKCEFVRNWWPDGLLMDGERNELHRLARGKRQAVDLGTFQGLSAVILSLAAERVHTVDAFESVAERPSTTSFERHYKELWHEHKHTLSNVQSVLSRYGNITAEHNDTVAAGYDWPSRDIDILFVDADHSKLGTIANVKAWWPKLLPGATIVFHDDNDVHPGVQQAVREIAGSGQVRPVPLGRWSGSLTAFQKVGDGHFDTNM